MIAMSPFSGVLEGAQSVQVRSGASCSNLATDKGRRTIAQLILAISLFPVLALVTENAYVVTTSQTTLTYTLNVKDDMLLSVQMGLVVHSIQRERGTMVLYISSDRATSVSKSVLESQRDCDREISNLPERFWAAFVAEKDEYFNQTSTVTEIFQTQVFSFRKEVDTNGVDVDKIIEFYSGLISQLIHWMASWILKSANGQMWAQLVAYHMLVLGKEQAGIERALGSTFFAQGQYTVPQMHSYLQHKLLGINYLQLYEQYASGGQNYIASNYKGTQLETIIDGMRKTIVLNVPSPPDVEMGTWWFGNMTSYINILKEAQDSIAIDIVTRLDDEISNQRQTLVVSISVMSAAVFLLILVIVSVHRLTKRLQSFAVNLQEKTVALNIERKRSENLLNQLLPPSVAKKMITNQPIDPEAFQSVTIFFSDIVGFTQISSRSSPMQVIDMLNMLYETFDETLDLYAVYKVETIGDAYMVASGLPIRNEEGHASEMAELALELKETICNMTVPHLPNVSIKIRIGLNSGSVVAGVVGHKMPRYCLFGDTVNVASRMESSGMPLRIHITQATFNELTRRGGFVMESRGPVEIKGKGIMHTYWLCGQTHFRPRRRRETLLSLHRTGPNIHL